MNILIQVTEALADKINDIVEDANSRNLPRWKMVYKIAKTACKYYCKHSDTYTSLDYDLAAVIELPGVKKKQLSVAPKMINDTNVYKLFDIADNLKKIEKKLAKANKVKEDKTNEDNDKDTSSDTAKTKPNTVF